MSTATANAPARQNATPYDPSKLPSVHARIGVATPPGDGSRPVSTNYMDPARVNVGMAYVDAVIRNARPIVSQLSLDREGFTLAKHRSKFANYTGTRDSEELRRDYLPELVPLIKEMTGASWVIPRDESVRVRSSQITGRLPVDGIEPVAARVHRDYTEASAKALFEVQMQKGLVPRRPYSRFSIVQTWRALTPPPQDQPLCILDASTFTPNEVLLTDTVFGPEPAQQFETTFGLYNPKQLWYYFPDMVEDDLIVFKGHDSAYPQSMYAMHTSFDNRSFVSNPVPRESVESRYFVFYE